MAVAGLVLSVSSFANATIINPPGYSDTLYLSGAGGWGSMAHASNGDVYYSKSGGVFKYDGVTTTSLGAGLGLEIIGNNLFIGGYNNNTIKTYNLSTEAISTIGTISSNYINGFALASNDFVGHEGELLIATLNGVFAYNLLTAASSNIWGGAIYSDIIVDNDGRVLATDYSAGVSELMSNGTKVSLGTVGQYDALALYAPSGESYMANSNTDTIDVLKSDNTVTQFAIAANFNGGWFPSPLSFNTDFTKLYYADGNDIRVISGFDGIAEVPEPSTIAFLSLGLMGLAARRFKKQA